LKGFATLLLVAALIFVGYTYKQVTGLQADVRRLKAEVSNRPVVSRMSSGDHDVAALLGEAASSCRRARNDLDRGDKRGAKKELDLCIRKLSAASSAAEDSSSAPDVSLAWKQVRRQLDSLWRQFAKESGAR
jgi:hypothetical protein